jgi:6-phosphofructokinase 1
MLNRIGVLTRDCAGVNAAIRSIVRTAHIYNIEVIGFLKGFDGLIDNNYIKLDRKQVSGIIDKGGTILKTSRSKRFYKTQWISKAIKNIRDNHIDCLIVVGGNGSLKGAHLLASEYNIPTIGIPATIDNDINGVDFSIGTDTAVNIALDALDKIRDTATSLERIFVIEVMGRKCGYIALQVALAGGCEDVIIPEREFDYDIICKRISEGILRGKNSWIIVVSEGKANAKDVADIITRKTGLETRVTVLGHIQRGGSPTATDRILASKLGNHAIDILKSGEKDKCICLKNGNPASFDLSKAIKKKMIDSKKIYNLIKMLT